MKRTLILICAFLSSGHATWAQNSYPDLSKYQCLKVNESALHITQEDAFVGKGFPHVFAEPTSASRALGTTSEIVTVAWPLIKTNGFVQVLWGSNRVGWVAATTLIPLRKKDGSIGGCTLRWREPGRIEMSLDPGVAVQY